MAWSKSAAGKEFQLCRIQFESGRIIGDRRLHLAQFLIRLGTSAQS
jgi:hypothetical protein